MVDHRVAEMLQKMIYMGGAGVGLGIAGRTLAASPPLKPKPIAIPFVSPGPSVVPIKLPGQPEEEGRLPKVATLDAAAIASQLPQTAPADAASSPDYASLIGAASGIGLGVLPAAYGFATSPKGRRLHGAASTASQTTATVGGLGAGGALGALAGSALGGQLGNPAAGGLVGAGLGAGVGGYLGNMWGKATTPGPVELGLGPKGQPVKEEELAKAGAGDHAVDPHAGWFHNNVLMPIAQSIPQDSITKNVNNIANAPGMFAGRVVAPAAGLIGGWKLADWMLNQRQKQESIADLDAAKNEYDQTLTGKSAAATALHALADSVVSKLANVADLVGPLAGGAALVTGAVGLGSGYMGYKYRRDNSRSKMIEKALQNRSRQLWSKSLQPVQFVPQAEVPVGTLAQ